MNGIVFLHNARCQDSMASLHGIPIVGHDTASTQLGRSRSIGYGDYQTIKRGWHTQGAQQHTMPCMYTDTVHVQCVLSAMVYSFVMGSFDLKLLKRHLFHTYSSCQTSVTGTQRMTWECSGSWLIVPFKELLPVPVD